MLDDVASDIDAAHMDGPVLDGRVAPVFDKVDAPARKPKDAPSLDLRLQRADAFFASADPEDGDGITSADVPMAVRKPVVDSGARSPAEDNGSIPADEAPSASGRVLRYAACAVAIAGLCGLAWAAGAHQSGGRSPVDTASAGPGLQGSAHGDELAGAVRQMSERLGALEARVDAKDDAKDAMQQIPSSPAQSTTGKDIAALSGRLDDMDAKLAAKLSQIDERLASFERRGPAARATAVARAQPMRHHAKHLHDAFDPTRDPGAPGAPHPLGFR